MKLLEKALLIVEKIAQRHILFDENGIPLSLLITAGNMRDITEMHNLINIRKHNYKGTILLDKGYKSNDLYHFNLKIYV